MSNTNAGNGKVQIIIYVILGLLLSFFVAWIVWKGVKGKVMKKKQLKLDKIKNNEIRELYYDYISSFHEIIKYALKEVDNFEPSIGEVKMQAIKDGANNLILKLLNRKDFASSFIGKAEYDKFIENCELLGSTNCNIWRKKINPTLEFFKDEYNKIPASTHKDEYIELVSKSVKEQYYGQN